MKFCRGDEDAVVEQAKLQAVVGRLAGGRRLEEELREKQRLERVA
ncbi:MAG: hypothetical protein V4773_23045 [Verrucomicrobiota bacterium]